MGAAKSCPAWRTPRRLPVAALRTRRAAGQPHPVNAQALWRLTPDHETYQQPDVLPSRKTTMAAERKAKE